MAVLEPLETLVGDGELAEAPFLFPESELSSAARTKVERLVAVDVDGERQLLGARLHRVLGVSAQHVDGEVARLGVVHDPEVGVVIAELDAEAAELGIVGGYDRGHHLLDLTVHECGECEPGGDAGVESDADDRHDERECRARVSPRRGSGGGDACGIGP